MEPKGIRRVYLYALYVLDVSVTLIPSVYLMGEHGHKVWVYQGFRSMGYK